MDVPSAPNRALIVRRPWSELIVDGSKTWEIRSNPCKIRGRICIAEAGTQMLVGEVDIESCSLIRAQDILDGNYGLHWNESFRQIPRGKKLYAWVLNNASRYPEPVPYVHPRGVVKWVKI